MTPLLTGVFASQISGHLTPPFTPTGSFDAIASYTVPSGGSATIEFVGIPSGYKHLQLRCTLNQDAYGDWRGVYMRFNNDTSSNYIWHAISGGGSGTPGASSSGAQTFLGPAVAIEPSGIPAASIIDIVDYNSNSKFKTIRAIHGAERNTTPSFIEFQSGLWRSTSSITSIKFTVNANYFLQHSKISLYGIKG